VKLTPCDVTTSCVTFVAAEVAASIETPGLTMAWADSRTLKSFTEQTHQSMWTTLGTSSALAAKKAGRSAIAGAVSYIAPPVSTASLSVGWAKRRLRLLELEVVSRARQTMKSAFWTRDCMCLVLVVLVKLEAVM